MGAVVERGRPRTARVSIAGGRGERDNPIAGVEQAYKFAGSGSVY